ncbi:SIS domain-containing protein [Lactococcus termiticola]|uniref:Tagatose-6-phosphate ketose isomerase n=1 Tax=Lactococcus termiticola TaxID=2169526 RepID=A0A2R5HE23_9LACT|nr:SIS domain-containing protein [Lactococcus termiticola]GBG96324.1 tagatose-6-phosphate ketose isomerase [Lactococcus termiticola]
MFELAEEELKAVGAIHTVKETLNQPDLWREVWAGYIEQREEIEGFLAGLISQHGRLRVIFTGAGSSQYVGDILVKSLTELGDTEHFSFESIGTTDIVSAPKATLVADRPTLLVSFARSGNSPESVATVDLVEQVVKDSYHLVLTCASEGQLAKKGHELEKGMTCLLPPSSNDQGFAMTGSCSSMTLLATLIFSQEKLGEKEEAVNILASLAEDIFRREDEITACISRETERLVYLGSSSLAGFVREASLKVLELTAGQIATVFDSSMGFRHGPKSFINDKTAVFIFMDNQAYTRKYDMDLYHEVKKDGIAERVLAIGQGLSEDFSYKTAPELKSAYLVFPAFVFAHVIALKASLLVGNTPDTPSHSGTVNRVVKGVKIYPYKE